MKGGPPVLFWVIFGMVPIWFILLKFIFRRLERHHPTAFRELGDPSLFWNNSMKNSTARALDARDDVHDEIAGVPSQLA